MWSIKTVYKVCLVTLTVLEGVRWKGIWVYSRLRAGQLVLLRAPSRGNTTNYKEIKQALHLDQSATALKLVTVGDWCKGSLMTLDSNVTRTQICTFTPGILQYLYFTSWPHDLLVQLVLWYQISWLRLHLLSYDKKQALVSGLLYYSSSPVGMASTNLSVKRFKKYQNLILKHDMWSSLTLLIVSYFQTGWFKVDWLIKLAQ